MNLYSVTIGERAAHERTMANIVRLTYGLRVPFHISGIRDGHYMDQREVKAKYSKAKRDLKYKGKL